MEVSKLKIDFIPEYDIESWDLNDMKDMNKFVEKVKDVCRKSFEYKQMVRMLRDHLDMNVDSFFPNFSSKTNTKLKIEIHHTPFSIHDIIRTVINKRMDYDEVMTEPMVAKEVMYLHYTLMVGLIPLCKTVHKLVHNQYLFIPTDAVFGFYNKFKEAYSKYLPDDVKVRIDAVELATENYTGDDRFVLDTHLIYLDYAGQYDNEKYEELKKALSERISKI